MQTFLPYPSFSESMKCLDPKRLGNQVYRECLTLIRGGWSNHPIAKMWKKIRAAAEAACEAIKELIHCDVENSTWQMKADILREVSEEFDDHNTLEEFLGWTDTFLSE